MSSPSPTTIDNSDSHVPDSERGYHNNASAIDAEDSSNTMHLIPDYFPVTVNTDARNSTVINVGGDIRHITPVNQSKELLASLNPVDQGGYYVSPCMAGTREKVLEDIGRWLDDVDAPNILWLSGSPGAGKSAIASSLVSRLLVHGRLGSGFFFKRGDIALSDPAAVWRTVAYDLAQNDTTFSNNLTEISKGKRILHTRPDVALHFRYLIEMPLTKSYKPSEPRPIPVVVIDALDECNSEGPQGAQRRHFLHTLTQWSCLSPTFKLVITSRDERTILEPIRAICRQMTLPTGDGVSNEVNQDIRRFFEERFARQKHSFSPESRWKHVLDELTTRAAGLFIWAETVVRFVEQGLPVERLELALRGELGGGNDITKLYQQILQYSFPEANGRMLEVFRLVVGTILLAKGPIYYKDLQQLVLEPDSSVNCILDKLSSVISIGPTDGTYRIGHLSFGEFLCDRQRCPEGFFINRGSQSAKLAMSCFRVMKDGLKFNICDLETSYFLNDDVKDLSRRMEDNISTVLQYSCRFWAAHLRDTTFDPSSHAAVVQEIKDFLYIRLLFWLEIMSLKKAVSAANVALLTMAYWIQSFDKEIAAIAQDSSRFVVNFFTPISRSAPHVYISALSFAPAESFVAKEYRSHFPNTLATVSGGDQSWPAVINIFRGHIGSVYAISFSADGKRLASGSGDHTIRIWDSETGETVAGPFEGHTEQVWCVAFSPDGKMVASGSGDHTIRVWDALTGETLKGFEGQTSVWSVAFSPDCKWVASGSADETIHIWDTVTGETVSGPLEGHTGSVWSVAFSPDGKTVASGSGDKTVRIWDAGTGEVAAGPFEGHTEQVWSVAFSPDGNMVASGSGDQTVRIWNALTGETVMGPFEGQTSVWSVAFSPDGRRVASGSADETIHIWDTATGETVAGPLEGHDGSVWSVAFSPDGKTVASGSEDHTIRFCHSETNTTTNGSSESQIKPVSPIPFALDDLVASGSQNSTVRVWDARTGQVVAGPFEGNTDVVFSVTCPPDDKHVASGFHDVTLHFWDAKANPITAGPFRRELGFLELPSWSDGWVSCSDLKDPGSNGCGHLFWVPKSCREALCAMDTLIVLGKRTTRLDLGRFVHSTSWTQCYNPRMGSSHSPKTCLYAPVGNRSSRMRQRPSPPASDRGTKSDKHVWDRVAPYPGPSEPVFVSYLQNTAFILIPFIAGYYFHAIISSK